jgi:hypothetical protein
MKKQIIIAAIVLLVSASAGIFFYACQKDEAVKTTSNTYCATCEAENAEKVLPDIDELIAQTGIDIYALSEKDFVQDYMSATNQHLISHIESQQFMQAKSKQIDETDLKTMDDLLTKMRLFGSNGNNKEFFSLAEQFFSLVEKIGILKSENLELQDWEFDGHVYKLPYRFIEQEQEQAQEFVANLTTAYPQFTLIQPAVQQQVLYTTFSICNTNSALAIPKTQKDKQKTCSQIRNEAYAKASAVYATSLTLCILSSGVATPIASGICVAVAVGIFVWDMADADVAFERCIKTEK